VHRGFAVWMSRAAGSALVSRVRWLSGLDRGRPGTEELERLFGARTGLGGVGEDRQPVVCSEVQPVVAQAELADRGMVELLDTGVVEAHVVRGPTRPERLAVCCELADEV
jgi:hypothetical protein